MAQTHTTETALVLIENTHCTVYTSKFLAGQTIKFPAGMIAHMDVIQSDVLFGLIASLIDSAHIEHAVILFFFGPTLYFEKKTPLLSQEKLEDEKKILVASTPFDRVAVKEYKSATNITLISINRDFFDTFREGFSQGDSFVAGVIPAFVLTPFLVKGQLTQSSVKTILTKVDSLQDHTIASVRAKDLSLQEQEQYLSSHYRGLIVFVFLFFLFVLGGLTWFILKRQAASLQPSPTPIAVTVPSPIATSLPTTEPTPLASASGTTVTILTKKQTSSASAQLKTALEEKGFVVIVKNQTATVLLTKTQVTIGESLTANIRTLFEETVKQILPDYSVQQGADLGSDVTVTLTE